MQHAHSQLSQQLKATKRAHRLFSSLVEDVAGGGGGCGWGGGGYKCPPRGN
ncbi:hypothetical protein [Helicobacter felis]|uniref:hypothetical protein n=1 Tax=Helicobacter felis TaxID=214 RepID=UPI0018F8030F|nr:hypothetical protein [Helicobacter felis]